MESGRQALAPIMSLIIFYGGEVRRRSWWHGLTRAQELPHAIAGIVAGALGQEWGVSLSRGPKTSMDRKDEVALNLQKELVRGRDIYKDS